MAQIKTDETHMECQIKIKQRAFDALLITHATCQNLDGLSMIEQPRLNHNDSHSCILSKPLIKDQAFHPTVTHNLPYKLRCSSTF